MVDIQKKNEKKQKKNETGSRERKTKEGKGGNTNENKKGWHHRSGTRWGTRSI